MEHLSNECHRADLCHESLDFVVCNGAREWFIEFKLKPVYQLSQKTIFTILRNNDINTINFITKYEHRFAKTQLSSPRVHQSFLSAIQNGNLTMLIQLIKLIQCRIVALKQREVKNILAASMIWGCSCDIKNEIDSLWESSPSDKQVSLLIFYQEYLKYPSVKGFWSEQLLRTHGTTPLDIDMPKIDDTESTIIDKKCLTMLISHFSTIDQVIKTV